AGTGAADLPLTIPQVVDRAVDRFGDLEAMVDGDVRLTFAELGGQIGQAARALIASGVEPGDRVAIWAPNVCEWAVTSFAVHSIGGVVIPINTRFKGDEAAYVLETAGARRLFIVTDFLDTDYVALLRGATQSIALDDVVVLRGGVPDGCTAWTDC